ncbi:MAG: ribonuclease H-like domain-containing protein [Thermoplasmatota archaeon]
MLRRSFIFLPGVGERTEERIWSEGILDWDLFLERKKAGPLRGCRKEKCDTLLGRTRDRLLQRDLGYFSRLLRPADNWRLWDEFGEGAVFLDIETMGTRRFHPITVVGAWDGRDYTALVRGKDLDHGSIRSLLDDATMLVTFNGRTFDIPMIESRYPGSVPDVPHLDLRFLGSRCGLRGGLKSVEISLGLARPDDVKGMSGEDAVRLWHLYDRDRNRNALKLLLRYNMEDTVNLETLAKVLVSRMKEKVIE